MAKNKPVDEPVELLDIRGFDRPTQVKMLMEHYKKAYDIWKPYPQIDPRLKETFLVLSETLQEIVDD